MKSENQEMQNSTKSFLEKCLLTQGTVMLVKEKEERNISKSQIIFLKKKKKIKNKKVKIKEGVDAHYCEMIKGAT